MNADRGYLDRAESSSYGTSNCFTVPEGVSLFKPNTERAMTLDILGYVVGEGNPFKNPGQIHPERTYYLHQNIGLEQSRVICRNKTWKEPCPVCEDIGRMKRNP